MDVREKLVELLVEFVEVDVWDNGEFIEKDIDFQKIASNLIANGVTVQEWRSVNECMPEDLEENKGKKVINCIVEHDPYGNKKTTTQFRQRKYDSYYKERHWSKIGGCTVTRWTTMPQPPKGE